MVGLLVSHPEGQLAPQRVGVVGDLVLWNGPLGKTVGETHPDLFEDTLCKTHFARSMRMAAVKYEEVTEYSPPSKPWVFSGQSGRGESEDVPLETKEKIMVLPNQMRTGDNKALGLGYDVKEVKLRVMTSINFSKRKKKMRLGQDLLEEQVRAQTPNPLA